MSRKQPSKLRLRESERAKIDYELEVIRQKKARELGKCAVFNELWASRRD